MLPASRTMRNRICPAGRESPPQAVHLRAARTEACGNTARRIVSARAGYLHPTRCTRSPSAQMRRSDREIAAYPIRPHARAFFYPARSERKHSNTPTGAFPNAVRGFAAFCLDRLARAAEDSASRRKKSGMPPVFPNPLPNPAFFPLPPQPAFPSSAHTLHGARHSAAIPEPASGMCKCFPLCTNAFLAQMLSF